MKSMRSLAAALATLCLGAAGCGETPSVDAGPDAPQELARDVSAVAPEDVGLDARPDVPSDASQQDAAPDVPLDARADVPGADGSAPSTLPTTWRDDYLPEFRFDVTPADLALLLTAGHADRHPATLRYMGQTFRGTIRQRLGNNSRCGTKRQFRFDFAEAVTLPDGYRTDRFETDRGSCYMLHEWLSVHVMRQAAARHPELRVMWKHANLVAVYFNDRLYQVQTLTEDTTRAIPERFLGTRDVTMYSSGCSADMPDAWLASFCTPMSAAALARTLDVPAFLYWAAVVKTLSPDDNFPDTPWNWYLVRNNATNVAYPLGDDWDSLPASWDPADANPFAPRVMEDAAQGHFVALLADAGNRTRYTGYLREVREIINPATLGPVIDAKFRQVRPLIAMTPDPPQTNDWYDFVYTEELPMWLRARYDFLARTVP